MLVEEKIIKITKITKITKPKDGCAGVIEAANECSLSD
jgi:uncharacterized protein YkvS